MRAREAPSLLFAAESQGLYSSRAIPHAWDHFGLGERERLPGNARIADSSSTKAVSSSSAWIIGADFCCDVHQQRRSFAICSLSSRRRLGFSRLRSSVMFSE